MTTVTTLLTAMTPAVMPALFMAPTAVMTTEAIILVSKRHYWCIAVIMWRLLVIHNGLAIVNYWRCVIGDGRGIAITADIQAKTK